MPAAGYALSGWPSKNRAIKITCEGEVREGTASRQILPRYHLHHLDYLASSHPELMPAQTPQLLIEIGRHQEENQEGRGFRLFLGIACQM